MCLRDPTTWQDSSLMINIEHREINLFLFVFWEHVSFINTCTLVEPTWPQGHRSIRIIKHGPCSLNHYIRAIVIFMIHCLLPYHTQIIFIHEYLEILKRTFQDIRIILNKYFLSTKYSDVLSYVVLFAPGPWSTNILIFSVILKYML